MAKIVIFYKTAGNVTKNSAPYAFHLFTPRKLIAKFEVGYNLYPYSKEGCWWKILSDPSSHIGRRFPCHTVYPFQKGWAIETMACRDRQTTHRPDDWPWTDFPDGRWGLPPPRLFRQICVMLFGVWHLLDFGHFLRHKKNVDSDIIHILRPWELPDTLDKPKAHAMRRHLLTYSSVYLI